MKPHMSFDYDYIDCVSKSHFVYTIELKQYPFLHKKQQKTSPENIQCKRCKKKKNKSKND